MGQAKYKIATFHFSVRPDIPSSIDSETIMKINCTGIKMNAFQFLYSHISLELPRAARRSDFSHNLQ